MAGKEISGYFCLRHSDELKETAGRVQAPLLSAYTLPAARHNGIISPAHFAFSFPPLPPSGITAYAGGFRLKDKSVQFRYTHNWDKCTKGATTSRFLGGKLHSGAIVNKLDCRGKKTWLKNANLGKKSW